MATYRLTALVLTFCAAVLAGPSSKRSPACRYEDLHSESWKLTFTLAEKKVIWHTDVLVAVELPLIRLFHRSTSSPRKQVNSTSRKKCVASTSERRSHNTAAMTRVYQSPNISRWRISMCIAKDGQSGFIVMIILPYVTGSLIIRTRVFRRSLFVLLSFTDTLSASRLPMVPRTLPSTLTPSRAL